MKFPRISEDQLQTTEYIRDMIHDPMVVFFFFFSVGGICSTYLKDMIHCQLVLWVSMSVARDQRLGRPRTGKEK